MPGRKAIDVKNRYYYLKKKGQIKELVKEAKQTPTQAPFPKIQGQLPTKKVKSENGNEQQ